MFEVWCLIKTNQLVAKTSDAKEIATKKAATTLLQFKIFHEKLQQMKLQQKKQVSKGNTFITKKPAIFIAGLIYQVAPVFLYSVYASTAPSTNTVALLFNTSTKPPVMV